MRDKSTPQLFKKTKQTNQPNPKKYWCTVASVAPTASDWKDGSRGEKQQGSQRHTQTLPAVGGVQAGITTTY